jgi:hypothetical protein
LRGAGAALKRARYPSFDDERLSGLGVELLRLLLDEFYRHHLVLGER